MDLFTQKLVPLDVWVQSVVDPVALALRPFFQGLKWPVANTLGAFEAFLIGIPHGLFLALAALLTWQVSNLRLAGLVVVGFTVIGMIGVWKAAMTTLSLVITAVLFCVIIGVPLGIWTGRSDRAERALRPILDVMQTLPAFVYLVPVVMLLGIGNVSGVIVTIVFALPPLIRLTALGLRQVPANLVEAARAFGSSERRLLWRVQLPLAAPSIMAGINQTLMMALAMTVIASMISVDGLGMVVLRGIGRLDMGLATVGGVGIVLLAMMLDRVTQAAAGQPGAAPSRMIDRGPIGLLRRSLSARTRSHSLSTKTQQLDREK
jgi:glycine betaine/proline transport system permease protein